MLCCLRVWHHDGHVPLEIKSEKIRAKAKKATTQYNKHRKEPIDVGERRSLWTT